VAWEAASSRVEVVDKAFVQLNAAFENAVAWLREYPR
jgi:hypothetical protein